MYGSIDHGGRRRRTQDLRRGPTDRPTDGRTLPLFNTQRTTWKKKRKSSHGRRTLQRKNKRYASLATHDLLSISSPPSLSGRLQNVLLARYRCHSTRAVSL